MDYLTTIWSGIQVYAILMLCMEVFRLTFNSLRILANNSTPLCYLKKLAIRGQISRRIGGYNSTWVIFDSELSNLALTIRAIFKWVQSGLVFVLRLNRILGFQYKVSTRPRTQTFKIRLENESRIGTPLCKKFDSLICSGLFTQLLLLNYLKGCRKKSPAHTPFHFLEFDAL